jgi:hypothetical protein
MPKVAIVKKTTIGNCPSYFDPKEEGISLLPRAHQMCESMTTPNEPTFTHNLQMN